MEEWCGMTRVMVVGGRACRPSLWAACWYNPAACKRIACIRTHRNRSTPAEFRPHPYRAIPVQFPCSPMQPHAPPCIPIPSYSPHLPHLYPSSVPIYPAGHILSLWYGSLPMKSQEPANTERAPNGARSQEIDDRLAATDWMHADCIRGELDGLIACRRN
jgi:hypothetical protein